MSNDSYGDAFGRRFGAEAAPAFVTRSLRKSEVAVTYLRQDIPTFEMSEPQPFEDAFLVSYVLQDNPRYALWENGRPVPSRPVLAGETTFYDFKARPIIHVNNPMNALHFYVPRAAFDALADQSELARIGELNIPHGHGVDDLTIRALGTTLLPAFRHPEQASRLFVDCVTLALCAHVAHRYGGMREPGIKRGGLAPWQERRALELLDAHLDGDITPGLLAQECRLSPSHFARAFRVSTGLAPHQWLLHRRVAKAKAALRDSDASLSAIALACGFADQSHFTRVFSRCVGIPPAAWRRSIRN
jgi:AraC family transcriptional regulator